MNNELLNTLEEHAFYESGLSADGCYENLDEYARQAITKYGRILISEMQEVFVMQTKLVVDLETRLLKNGRTIKNL